MRAIVELSDKESKDIIEHLKGLDETSRRMRFFSNISDKGIEAYVERISWGRDVCFGLYYQYRIVGFVHLGYVDDDQYELGVSVSEEMKGEGIGIALMKRVMTWCKAKGVTKLVMECLRENSAMNHIAKKLGMRIVHDKETALAEAAIYTTYPERITEIQKNILYENVAIIDRSVRSFYNQCLTWGKNDHK